MAEDDRTLTSNITPFGLRMQPEVKALVEAAARENKRSLNAEINSRVASYDAIHDKMFVLEGKRRELEAENIVLRGAVEEAINLPSGLRERIERAADEHERPLIEEVIQALEAAFPPPAPTRTMDELIELHEYLLKPFAKFSALKGTAEQDETRRRAIAQGEAIISFLRQQKEAGVLDGEEALQRFTDLHYWGDDGLIHRRDDE